MPKSSKKTPTQLRQPISDEIFCALCEDYIIGGCLKHRVVFISDEKPLVAFGESRFFARRTLPPGLYVGMSQIHSEGVFAAQDFKPPLAFGPYGGVKRYSFEEADASGYSWEIMGGGAEPLFWVDGEDKRRSNWLRYVNHSSEEGVQNLVAVELNRAIYYFLKRPVKAGDELFVSYGEDYGDTLAAFHRGHPDVHAAVTRDPGHRDLGFGDVCPDCKGVFSTAEFLAAHVKSCRRRPKAVRCPSCPASFSWKHNLVVHLREVHASPLFRCAECGKQFNRAHNLRRHGLVHSELRPFSCSVCDKDFRNDFSRIRHVRNVHEGRRAFKCTFCGCAFGEHYTKTRHMRICSQK